MRARNPARLVPLAFVMAIAVGTAVMMLPAARAGPTGAPFITALFTAASAICVTGLATVDTPVYWSGFGQAMIMALTQLGGFGIVTAATLLTLAVTRRLGLRTRLLAQTEGRSLGLTNVRQVLVRVALTMLAIEGVIATVLALRWWLGYGYAPLTALWYGAFHAVAAFNNGGFTLYSTSLAPFVGDGWICIPITLGVVIGSLGFPVLFEVARSARHPGRWSTHTRLTVAGSAVLLVAGVLTILGLEWTNPATLGPLGVPTKLLAAFTQGAMPRSGGFSSVDIGGMRVDTLLFIIVLMFIGGGSASTAGGIKLTTFLILGYVIWAEAKGDEDVVVGRRRIPETVQRQAVAVALLGVGAVIVGCLAILSTTTGVSLEAALFEATSAFGTVGLSTGLTPHLPAPAQAVVTALMFTGRVGTISLASSLALTNRPRLYHYPEERPIVG